MILKGHHITFKQIIFLFIYYSFAIYLPDSNGPIKFGATIRRFVCKRIFKKCGNKVMIHRGARFGIGINIEIGDYSDIGINANIPGDTIIGDYVLMAANCFIFDRNHKYSDLTIPIKLQGATEKRQTIIEDDVWIGKDVTMTPGRHVKKGTIIGTCCLLTKDYPEYSIVGGNPSQLIKSRKHNDSI